tara:strand:+ start:136 stop:549 length:414 start_codon:yes stop_codon:yes gene_type:complete
MKIEITGLDALAKSIDNLSIAIVSLKFPRQVSVVKAETVTEEVAPPAKKKRAAKKVAAPVVEETPAPVVEETPVEVVPDTERTEEEVTTKAKELIAKFSPVELRAILDDTVGVGIKISTAPKEKYAAVYDALVAKLS